MIILKILKEKKLLHNFFWESLSTVSLKIFSFISSIIIARSFGEEFFGKWGVILGLIMTLIQIAIPNLSAIIVTQVAENKEKNKEYSSEVLGFMLVMVLLSSIILNIFVFFGSELISKEFYNNSKLFFIIKVFSFSFVFLMLKSYFKAILMAFEDFRASSLVEISSWVLFVAGVLITVTFKLKEDLFVILFYIISQALSALIGVIIVKRVLKKHEISIVFKEFKKCMNIFWKFSLPGIITAGTQGPVDVYTKSIIVKLPKGLESMGGVQAVYNWYTFITFIPMIICRIMTPVFSTIKGTGNVIKLKNAINKSVLISFLISLLFSLPVIMFSGEILSIYGEGFLKYDRIFKIIVFSGLIESTAHVIMGLYAVFSIMWLRTINTFIYSFLFLTLAVYLVPNFGIEGYAFSLLISRVFMVIFTVSSAFYGYLKFARGLELGKS